MSLGQFTNINKANVAARGLSREEWGFEHSAFWKDEDFLSIIQKASKREPNSLLKTTF